jgi:hypothetical protein
MCRYTGSGSVDVVARDGSGELGETLAWVSGTPGTVERCMFHPLPNVKTTWRSECQGKHIHNTRTQLVEQAAQVCAADDTRARSTQWREQSPQAVAACECDDEQPLSLPCQRVWHLTGSARGLWWSAPLRKCAAGVVRLPLLQLQGC